MPNVMCALMFIKINIKKRYTHPKVFYKSMYMYFKCNLRVMSYRNENQNQNSAIVFITKEYF